MANPELKLGEAYMDGTMRIERGSIADFLDPDPCRRNRTSRLS